MSRDILEALDPGNEDERNTRAEPPLAPETPVFVPAHPRYPADPTARPRIAFELLSGPDGGPVPVAFTNATKLVEALGDAQPWVAIPVRRYVELMRDNGFGHTHLDPKVAAGSRTWSYEAVNAYAEAIQ
jgi:hypothetical protein